MENDEPRCADCNYPLDDPNDLSCLCMLGGGPWDDLDDDDLSFGFHVETEEDVHNSPPHGDDDVPPEDEADYFFGGTQ